MSQRFIAIDLETANADVSSICQIGMAVYENGVLVQEWETLVDPLDYFDEVNIQIHGINESQTRGKPTLAEIFPTASQILESGIAVCHTHFDRTAINKACDVSGLARPCCEWLDTAKVARRTWPQFAQSGYGLRSVCDFLQYNFRHHHALEDAKASGFILNKAIEQTGLSLLEWQIRTKQPITQSSNTLGGSSCISRSGLLDGHLYGECVVFTGKLSQPRGTMADIAANAGCDVSDDVSKRTTILVVGDQDLRVLKGQQKSSKHRKADKHILAGIPMSILTETDFLNLLKTV